MPIVSLNQQSKRVEIGGFEVENPLLFTYFDKLPASERDEKLHRALYIGALALMEDRISAFLSKTANELGTELESLKIIFDMKKELFYKSAIKGILAEEDIAEYLAEFLSAQRLTDKIKLTGNSAGSLAKNKTGDIIAYVDGKEDLKIVVECKFDKGIRLGDIQSKDIFTKKSDTAWSQLIEAQANRDAKVGVIVFDVSVVDSTILNTVQDVRYIPAVGFVAIIDSSKGDYKNLSIAYMLARDIAVNAKSMAFDKDVLSIIVNRILKDINETLNIRSLVYSNIETSKKILSQLDKSLLLMEFNQKYLAKFLIDGQFSKEDLLNFYSGDEIKDRFKIVETEIKAL
ncbi:hypothetical protein [Asticcacaulis sp. 201]|uniref:hypothetical protein n=1 Tax=Asticcacaulis sp. 201 TaxID=3028787 RepID=UPI002915F075|nr:hypothetical protein [Asticcacaulis sp. 201]MDV6333144.1 hypothetical protein [Asticcacaulis sp. 201]